MKRNVYIAGAMILGGLVVGGAVEHVRMSSKVQVPEEAEPEVIHHVQKVVSDSAAGSEEQAKLIASLNAKVAALTAELEKARMPKREGEEVQVERREGDRRDREGRDRESWDERMERMKTEEPERYAEMQQRREEFKARMEERKQSKRDFFSSINTATMTPEQRQNHERLVALTERVTEIGEMMMSGKAENRDELRQEMFESFGELHDLNELERVDLLEQTANAAGYEGDDAALFTEHIEAIIENTSMHGFGGPPGGRRGGRGGDGGGGNR